HAHARACEDWHHDPTALPYPNHHFRFRRPRAELGAYTRPHITLDCAGPGPVFRERPGHGNRHVLGHRAKSVRLGVRGRTWFGHAPTARRRWQYPHATARARGGHGNPVWPWREYPVPG